jgi:hypothetical protein
MPLARPEQIELFSTAEHDRLHKNLLKCPAASGTNNSVAQT